MEGEAVDFPEVTLTGRMRRLSAILWLKRCWFPQGEHLRPGGVFDCFPQGPGRMRLVSTPPWSFEASYV